MTRSRIPGQAPPAFVAAVRDALSAPPDGVDPWFLDYCGSLRDANGLERYVRAKRQLLALAGGVRGRDVLDAGSGFGMVGELCAGWGARRVFAVEVHEAMVRSHGLLRARHFAGDGAVHPLRADVSRLPLADRSVDVVLSIEAISHYFDVSAFLDECARVIRPGGHLLVSDGNNGANPRVRAATETLWERLELGPRGRLGEVEIPEPMVERRARIVAERFPALAPARVRALAERTSGLDRAGIESAVASHLAGGPEPDRVYRRGDCPREPFHGYWLERLFDPRDLAHELAERGFSARALPHFGGARGPLVHAANVVLRQLPLHALAPAFRVVARRR